MGVHVTGETGRAIGCTEGRGGVTLSPEAAHYAAPVVAAAVPSTVVRCRARGTYAERDAFPALAEDVVRPMPVALDSNAVSMFRARDGWDRNLSAAQQGKQKQQEL